MGGRIESPYEVLEDILAGAAKPTNLPLALLEDITEHFSEERKIGEGGFGTVYKGVFENQNIAVKKIVVNKYTVDDMIFRREVDILMAIKNHRNLVRFLGFCSNTARSVKEKTGSEETIYPQIMDRLLCFEYISNGSLDKYITDELRGLTWDTRFNIIREICEGLRYLHEDICIIHMDLKPANILLDDHMVPKITDFDLSRSVENTRTKGERFGTTGYLAPEYQNKGEMSDRADIYSLGVIIVELVTGSKHIPDETLVLRRWRHRCNKLPTQDQLQQVIKCMRIALSCREQEPGNRPSIGDIIRDLSEIGSTNGLSGQTRLYMYDGMLGIEPLELHFPLEHNKQSSCSVELSNDTVNTIAFNIQTPSKQYNAWPEKGIVLPGCKQDVKITLQPQESATQVMHSDKFVVQSTQVEEGLTEEDITEHMFKNKGGKKVVDGVNLMVIYHQHEEAVSKEIGSSSYNNTIYGSIPPESLYYHPIESISCNQDTNLMSNQNVDLATGAIGSLIPKLTELVKRHNLGTSIDSDVDCVISELRAMRIDLCHVSDVQQDNNNEQIKLVKLWAGEVRELSYDIEDVVDGFLMPIEGSEPATCVDGLMALIQKMMSLFMLGRTRHQIGGAIKGIKNQVQNKATWKGKYKVEDVVSLERSKVTSTFSAGNAHNLSTWAKDRNKLVGIDDAMKDFTKRLRGGDGKELRIHSIFGSGGLGKTTLATAVYKQLIGSFHLTAFVPVGRNPDVKKLFYDILFELDEVRYKELKPANLDERQLIHVLIDLLKNKRYLIVIDDMWDQKAWHDWIKFAFVDSKCGSKIIITTRIIEVATITTDLYKLDPLSHGYSAELFYATLSPDEGICEQVTDEVTEKIFSKCGGVPLALITMASLLASKRREDWPKVYNGIGFGNEVNEDAQNTRNILLFSYIDLPRPLRTCLLHLSIFPEDELIEKDMAIWMWVAEGFVDEKPGKCLFELGERYFNQLIGRSMIQLVKEGPQASFRIHDLVLDMICSLSKDENLVTVLPMDMQNKSFRNNAHRLAVQKIVIHRLDPPYCMVKLRSFYATDCRIDGMRSLSSFKALRVLSIVRCGFFKYEFYQLGHIGKLLHLRYLRLEGISIHMVPEEIGDLFFLQTLILIGTKVKELPHSVGLLRQLKCLRAPQVEVPGWMVNMTSLEDLSLMGVNMPLMLAEELGKLKELRNLEIIVDRSCGDNWKRALVKSIGNLINLQRLNILGYWCNGNNIWEGFGPLRHLHSMTMWVGFLGVPSWMDSRHLPSLSYLELNLLRMEARCLEILGRLPELLTLTLRTFPAGWLEVTGSGAFPKLRHLKSHGRMLTFERGVMPRLAYLEYELAVPELRDAKFDCDCTSLGNLPSLQKVSLVLLPWERKIQDDDPEYAKRMEAALKHVVDTYPHRRLLLYVLDNQNR